METKPEASAQESVAQIPVVLNTTDDPRNLSITTVGVYSESVDRISTPTPTPPEDTTDAEDKKELDKAEPNPVPVVPDPEKAPDKVITKDENERRIAVITKARRMAERELESTKTRIKELETEVTSLRQAIPAKDKPKAEDFTSDADFVEALTGWKVDQAMRAKDDADRRVAATVTEKQAIAETFTELDDIMEQGREKYADFNKLVLDENLKLSDLMTESALVSDMAAEVLYYLGQHPDESATIAALNPILAIREITKIEDKVRLTLNPPTPPDPPPPAAPVKKASAAPEPIAPPVQTGLTDVDPSKMTPREYRQWREKGKKT